MKVIQPVVLVGAGPGSIDLLTLRGLRYLQDAQVILADALIDPSFKSLNSQALWVPVGKRGGRVSFSQDRINRLLVIYALSGLRVVRLKGGDPSIFGRAEEEIAALQAAKIECIVVPGVSAALAAAADAKRPLTRRGRGRTVSLQTAVSYTNQDSLVDLESPQQTDSLVLYMAGQQLANLTLALRKAGWNALTPVVIVWNAGGLDSTQTESTVEQLAQIQSSLPVQLQRSPAIVTIGIAASPIALETQPLRDNTRVGLQA
jgi:uroporphyrin-III C-methyltransferase